LQEKQAAEIKVNEGKKSQIPMESINANAFSSRNNSPYKSPLKALHSEALKACVQNNQKAKPADAENNNKSTAVVNEDDDDDDSVFINESKQKKTRNTDGATVKHEANVSSLKSSNAKAPTAKLPSQNQNSRDSNVQSDTTAR
jgi:hypothetical protein